MCILVSVINEVTTMMVGGRAERERAKKRWCGGRWDIFPTGKKPEKRHFAKGGLKKLMSICMYVRT